MKATNTILAVTMMASLAMAQAPSTQPPAPKKPKAPASQAIADQAAPKPAAKTPAKAPAPAPKKPMTAAVAKAPAKPEAKPAETAAAAKKPASKRDPFVSPVVHSGASGPGAVCTTGKRCLAIGEMQLQGIVKTQSGMIAVVANQARRTYFLHENDAVFNGTVVKITADTVVFRENVVDNLGHEASREVVKRVTAPTV